MMQTPGACIIKPLPTRSKLVCLSQKLCVFVIDKVLDYNDICPFAINYKAVTFFSTDPRDHIHKPLFSSQLKNEVPNKLVLH
jgi:hypothetical protein